MVVIRNTNEIISSLIDYIKLVQPDADTKVGSMIRDLLIEPPATQLSLLYDQIANVSSTNSFRLVVGADLDNLSKNFGMTRKVPTAATGIAVLTFKDILAPLQLSQSDLVIATNGFSYQLNTGSTISSNSANYYRSIANKYANDLDILGITDEYAVEVTVIASTTGLAGNIGKYSLSRTTITGISNVFNPLQFIGGTDQETDASYRNRVLSVFTGSSIGTALGYLNTALGTTGVLDAQVIQPRRSIND